MAKENACDTGRVLYRTKREAERASAGRPVQRCHRCRQWHVVESRKRGRGKR